VISATQPASAALEQHVQARGAITLTPSMADLAAYWWNTAAAEAERLGDNGKARAYRYNATQLQEGTKR